MNEYEILGKLSTQQKIRLLNGYGNWNTLEIKEAGFESVRMSDGPHGLRKEIWEGKRCTTMQSTCFPPAVSLASSWDKDLIYKCSSAIADECLAADIDVLLGPGINIKRSSLCGRNFEYFSEDPYLAGHMAASYINGLQAKGIGASLKHFCCNNQETARKSVSAQVDERALRETYLQPFEIAVKQSQPFTVMSSYNRVDGEYVSESKRLIDEILRGEWGFDGLVVSDWESISSRTAALKAGVDLEMPDSAGNGSDTVMTALAEGTVTMNEIDKAVLNIIRLSQKCKTSKQAQTNVDFSKQHQTAREIMAECAVLLKNNGALPISKDSEICLIGALAETPLYQGNGSSRINSKNVVSLTQALKYKNIAFSYSPGYKLNKNCYSQRLINTAASIAKKCKKAVVVVGLTASYESEGADRASMRLPYGQLKLVEALLETGCKITVVLMCGSPVELPFMNDAEAILNMYCGGEAVGEAIVDLLFGDKNPCGKLAETFPLSLDDNINSALFPMGHRYVEYRESIFVGYKYFDTAQKKVAFPFGHGLSYTTFDYTGLCIESQPDDTYRVSCKVKNIGATAGKEVVQLYLGCQNSRVPRPVKELKGFCKLHLNPSEEKTADFSLDARSFAYYSAEEQRWVVEDAHYKILVGSSSRAIKLEQTIHVAGETPFPTLSSESVYFNLPNAKEITANDFSGLYPGDLPENMPLARGGYDYNSTYSDFRTMWIGKLAGFLLNSFCALALHYPDGADKKKQLFSELEVPIIREGFDKGTADKAESDAKLHIFNKSLPNGLLRLLYAGMKKRKAKKRE